MFVHQILARQGFANPTETILIFVSIAQTTPIVEITKFVKTISVLIRAKTIPALHPVRLAQLKTTTPIFVTDARLMTPAMTIKFAIQIQNYVKTYARILVHINSAK